MSEWGVRRGDMTGERVYSTVHTPGVTVCNQSEQSVIVQRVALIGVRYGEFA